MRNDLVPPLPPSSYIFACDPWKMAGFLLKVTCDDLVPLPHNAFGFSNVAGIHRKFDNY